MAGGIWKGNFFLGSEFLISEPEIWQKLLFLRNFTDFLANFGL